jgi:hypothetical protein
VQRVRDGGRGAVRRPCHRRRRSGRVHGRRGDLRRGRRATSAASTPVGQSEAVLRKDKSRERTTAQRMLTSELPQLDHK